MSDPNPEPKNPFSAPIAILLVIGTIIATIFIGNALHQKRLAREQLRKANAITRNILKRCADELDSQRTAPDVYIRPGGLSKSELEEKDAWGFPLTVFYPRGPIPDSFQVRSIGPDGIEHTLDDITEQRQATNSAGVQGKTK